MIVRDLGADIVVGAAPVVDVALILVLDCPNPFGPEFSADELGPYQKVGKLGRSWISYRKLTSVVPVGSVKRARDQMVRRLCHSIDIKELQVDRLRRSIDGNIDPVHSLLDVGVAIQWAEVYGLEVGDLATGFCEHAFDAVESLREAYFELQGEQDNDEEFHELAEQHSELPDEIREDYLRLLKENSRLKAERNEMGRDLPISTHARNTYLKIIAAMAYDCYRDGLDKPFALAKEIKGVAEKLGVSISDDSIAAKLKEAMKYIPERPLSKSL